MQKRTVTQKTEKPGSPSKKFMIIAAIAIAMVVIITIAIIYHSDFGSYNWSKMNPPVQDETDELNTGAAETEDADEIAIILSSRNESTTAMEESIIGIVEGAGYKVLSYNAWNDAEKQNALMEDAAASGVKAIIVDLVDPDAVRPLMEEFSDIPVVFMDKAPTDMEILNVANVAYCGSDENTASYYQGEYLAAYFESIGKSDMQYIMLQDETATDAQVEQSAGVLQALEDNWITATSVIDVTCKGERDEIIEKLTPVLSAGEPFDCIIANHDEMALGAIEACKAAGIDPSTFPIVSIGCSTEGVEAVQAGTLAMTVFKNYEGIGKGAAQITLNLLNGDTASLYTSYDVDESGESYSDSIVWVPYQKVTPNNVISYLN
ncbi:MAG: sugar ABC transporter substrate-binding protein [Clostridia bacterium]|nr:sugar ABC transporter substrate-binding protein [Clostridia bacterium]